MKNKALQKLKEKYEGVSDAILTRVAAKIANGIKDEADLDEAVEAVTFQQILESYGDSRADEAQKTAVTNYEKKHNLKDGKAMKQPDGDEPDEDNSIVPEWAKSLLEANKQLREEIANIKGEKRTGDRRTALSEITGKLPKELQKAYNRIQLDTMTDEEFETMKGEVETEVQGILDGQKAQASIYGRPRTSTKEGRTNNGTVEATDAEVDAVMARMNI